MPAQQARAAADQLNRDCFCVTLDQDALARALQNELGDADFFATLTQTRPHLFSHAPVFLPKADRDAMQAIVNAVEAAARLPAYQEAVLAWAPPIARVNYGAAGVFMGYDFHLTPEGPRLIEVNTNAGGAFFNTFLARAQIACCAQVERALALSSLATFDDDVIAMFNEEWRRQGRTDPLRRIAIVDERPQEQYLYPEFLLAKRLFERNGIETVIVDPSELRFKCDLLQHDGRPIDLIYNRLVDFALGGREQTAIRAAYEGGAVVITPNPRNHALLADKRNLLLLSNPQQLTNWGLDAEQAATLNGVPKTLRVNKADADQLWAERKNYFFKPAAGHGGKAVYRGDKLTKGVWTEILAGDYIAQAIAPPSERTIKLDGERVQRKVDVRLYAYDGAILIAAARLYQGQTTNFRTPGGGFAPVFFV
ncbi:hypothetical protein [Candidatus Viadribacter manganicus]|uniref:ATP-grasp domain-containing protein n=1 Tax=Candidatus Viadribacter manganicus TaxID=1759059 RepID=A0A1B1AH32_9PROT|nr:hypothetical protein [Candidatus Viadribacter manganicus]ANP45850.1 hypothetical protein ATE48_07880 [Candidatus Viadribacter manganicus]